MTLHLHRNSNRIARRAGEQGARPANVSQVAVEKSTTELSTKNENNIEDIRSSPPTWNENLRTRLLKGKKEVIISSLNVRTLRNFQLHELVASAEQLLNDVVCIQEHRFVHEDMQTKEHDAGNSWKLITSSAWKNTVNASIGGIAMLMSPHAYKSLSSIESVTPRILVANFNGNPQTSIICCYSPTNVTEEVETERFYDELSSIIRQIPKHNVLLIGGDFNAHLGQENGHKFAYHQQTNRNGIMLNNILKEQNLIALNTYFQKRNGQKWTHTSPNGAKTQLDYIIINKKWKNSAKNCRAYNSFEGVKTDHRVVSAKIILTLRANKNKTSRSPPFDWSLLKDQHIASTFTICLKNRFEVLQQIETEECSPNNTFNNFVASCEEAARETVPLKKRIKKRVPWDSEEVIKKRKLLQKMAEIKNSEPTTVNINNFNHAKENLNATYEKEQKKYIEDKIDEIANATTNQKSSQAWKAVNEISRRKTTNKGKIRAKNETERLKLWKDHFQTLLGKPPTIEIANTIPVIEENIDIVKDAFTMDELLVTLKNTKDGKACGLDNIPAEVWKMDDFNDILLQLCNAVYYGNPIDKWRQGCILPFPKKGDLGLASNYRGITLTSIAAKIYNSMLLNRLRPHIDPILRRNQNGFRQNRSTSGQILSIRRIIEGVKAKQLPAILLFIDFSKAFDSIHRQKMREILLAYKIPKETVNAIMILYSNTKSMIRSPDGDTDFFEITSGVLQGDTLAPYLFIICLDYVLRKSLDSNKELGFTLCKARSRRYPEVKMTDADYADDLAILSNYITDGSSLLHCLEKAASEVGLYINYKKTEFLCYNQYHSGTIKSMKNENIKAVQDFTYLGSSIASTKKDIEIRLGKAWSALNKLDVIWKSSLPANLKRKYFQATVESVLVYGATSWTLTKSLEKSLDGAYTRMLRAVLDLSWKQHPTLKELYDNIPPVSSTIRDRRLRFAGHCFRSKEEIASDLILWQPSHGLRTPGRPSKTFVDKLAEDMNCKTEELKNLMNDRKEWKERVMACRVRSTR